MSTLPESRPAAQDAPAPGADASAFAVVLHPLPLSAPLRWLALGVRDFGRAPFIGLFYGACFVGMGWALLRVFELAPAYTLVLAASFLLVGPFLCLGMYQTSMRLERGQRPDFGDSLLAWQTRTGTLAIFGVVLLVLEMLWGRAAMVLFAVSFDGMPDFRGSVMALMDPANLGFIVAYLAVGGVFAGLIFAISVVSLPMILHRQTDAITAGLTSLRLVLGQPLVMVWWGALITALVVLAALPWLLGLLVVGPVLGHASWHAYRAAVADAPSGPAAAAAPD
jgi:uncharacterized membrane protein